MKNKEHIWDEWFERANKVRTIEQFNELHDYLFKGNIKHTYDSIVHASSALTIAAAWLASAEEGLTGFQASYIKYDFIRQFDGMGRDTTIQVIDYDDVCYPQYQYKFPVKRISKDVWMCVQRACKKHLEDLISSHRACFIVRNYWGFICNGKIPYGFEIVDDDGTELFSVPPIVVERPMHTMADKDNDYNDDTSLWYDKERADAEYAEWKKRRDARNIC